MFEWRNFQESRKGWSPLKDEYIGPVFPQICSLSQDLILLVPVLSYDIEKYRLSDIQSQLGQDPVKNSFSRKV